MSEDHYAALMQNQNIDITDSTEDIWDLILNRPWQGSRTKQDIDAQINEERASWDDK